MLKSTVNLFSAFLLIWILARQEKTPQILIKSCTTKYERKEKYARDKTERTIHNVHEKQVAL